MNDRPPPPANAPKPDDEPVGIRCRSCGCPDHRVVYVRHAMHHCGRRFRTVESDR